MDRTAHLFSSCPAVRSQLEVNAEELRAGGSTRCELSDSDELCEGLLLSV
jgi:hypothetical protein